jgi:hypothetical protein
MMTEDGRKAACRLGSGAPAWGRCPHHAWSPAATRRGRPVGGGRSGLLRLRGAHVHGLEPWTGWLERAAPDLLTAVGFVLNCPRPLAHFWPGLVGGQRRPPGDSLEPPGLVSGPPLSGGFVQPDDFVERDSLPGAAHAAPRSAGSFTLHSRLPRWGGALPLQSGRNALSRFNCSRGCPSRGASLAGNAAFRANRLAAAISPAKEAARAPSDPWLPVATAGATMTRAKADP